MSVSKDGKLPQKDQPEASVGGDLPEYTLPEYTLHTLPKDATLILIRLGTTPTLNAGDAELIFQAVKRQLPAADLVIVSEDFQFEAFTDQQLEAVGLVRYDNLPELLRNAPEDQLRSLGIQRILDS